MTLQANRLSDRLGVPDVRVGRPRNLEAGLANLIWFGGLALLFVALLSAIANGAIREFYFIGDMMYLPTLYADLTQWSGRWADWSLTPAPYLFPDLLLYTATRSLGLSLECAHYFAGMLQTLGIVLGARAMLRSAAPEFASQASFVAPMFAFLFAGTSSKIVSIAPLFVISCHGGVALVSLAVLTLCIGSRGGRPTEVAIATLSALAAFSDPLFVVSVAVPAAGFAVILALPRNDDPAAAVARSTLRNRYLIAFGFGFAGALVTRLVNALTSARYLQPRPQRIGTTLRALLSDCLGPGRLEFGVLFATLLISLGVLVARNRRSLSAARRTAAWTIASTASSLAAIILTGRFHEGSFRYLIVPLVLGVTTVAALVGSVFERRWLMMGAATVVLAALGVQAVAHGQQLLHGQYESDLREQARCVADTALREHSDTVLSDYWHAKPLMLMAGGQPKVLQLDEQLEPRWWINSRAWYRGDHEIAVIVTNGLPLDELDRHFGLPSQTEHCQDLDLYVYRGPARVALEHTFQTELARFGKR